MLYESRALGGRILIQQLDVRLERGSELVVDDENMHASLERHGDFPAIHLAIGIAPDLFGGRLPVDLRVGGICELLWNP